MITCFKVRNVCYTDLGPSWLQINSVTSADDLYQCRTQEITCERSIGEEMSLDLRTSESANIGQQQGTRHTRQDRTLFSPCKVPDLEFVSKFFPGIKFVISHVGRFACKFPFRAVRTIRWLGSIYLWGKHPSVHYDL